MKRKEKEGRGDEGLRRKVEEMKEKEGRGDEGLRRKVVLRLLGTNLKSKVL